MSSRSVFDLIYRTARKMADMAIAGGYDVSDGLDGLLRSIDRVERELSRSNETIVEMTRENHDMRSKLGGLTAYALAVESICDDPEIVDALRRKHHVHKVLRKVEREGERSDDVA